MPVPDARTRNKIGLNPTILTNSLSSKQIPRFLFSNLLLVFSLHASKEWLLKYEVGVFWLVMRLLACGGLGVIVWEGVTGRLATRKSIEARWSALGMSSLLFFIQNGCLFVALYRLSTIRVLLFTQLSALWINSLFSFPKKAGAVGLAFLASVLSEAQFSTGNIWRLLPGYGGLLVYALSSRAFDHTLSVLSPSLGLANTLAATTLGGAVFALPFYMFRTVLFQFPVVPILPLSSLVVIPVIAYSVLFFTPSVSSQPTRHSFTSQYFSFTFPVLTLSSPLIGLLVFSEYPTWMDFIVAGLLYLGTYPNSTDSLTGPPRTPAVRLLRSYLKTILSNPESRKIFYFLLLNMCYMLVQMLYGVYTNSLGLISDAIHMAFDCMAIGVGLFASVMATWEPNEQFTYGYGRIETLSGFANGIFLILISVFIIFEAVQRILEPPEMNTSQLLLVSSLGLAVNLFGMFAMGGHHHHVRAFLVATFRANKGQKGGHSHSHGHSHGHGHGHAPEKPVNSHAHSHDAPDSHSHSHSHSDSHSHSPHTETSPESHHPVEAECDEHTTSAHSHSHSHSHGDHQPASKPVGSCSTRGPSHAQPPLLAKFAKAPSANRKRSFRGSDIATPPRDKHIESPPISRHLAHLNHLQNPDTPLTPNYKFGHDDHYSQHHESGHLPNAHDHSHVHTHEGHSHNMRGVFLHVMADTLGSVGVIISTLLIQFYGWTGFDPIASLFIAVLIAASVIPLVMDTGKVLALDVSDRNTTIHNGLLELSGIEGLGSHTNARFWPKDATSLIGSVHIQVSPAASANDPSGPHSSARATYTRIDRVVEHVDSILRRKIPSLEELTIQVGTSNTDFM
ncbi:cation efflux protein [Pluteus cervinus]|uniref:Cation efflux protein n=1 Tax=Pluteus cervinus TaxID=181527 RepID=A0ACD3BB08_9AGAR|nr:cation efflux protein [Pluteus cervinus]